MCTLNDETKNNWDATNSWSGYNYQGKVALFMTIKKINQLISVGTESEIDKYSLELEWVEDFSIVKEENQKRVYESIHQVKAKANKRVWDYEDAIIKLFQKVKENDSIGKAYLHVIRELDLEGKEWNDNVIQMIKQGTQIKESLKAFEEYRNANNADKEAAVEKISKPGRNSDINMVVIECNKKNFNYKKITIENIDAILDIIIQTTGEALSLCVLGISEEILDKIKLYSYTDTQEYCPLNEIDEKIKAEIIEYWRVTNAHGWKLTDQNLAEQIFLCLQGLIDKHVTERHINYNKTELRDIEFVEFIKILNSDNPTKRCEAYYLYLAKRTLIQFCERYHEECYEEWDSEQQREGKCKQCEIDRLYDQLLEMPEKEIKEFVYLLNPDVQGDIDELGWVNYCERLRINNPFLTGIRDIEQTYGDNTKFVSYTDAQKNTSLLTAIRHDDTNKALMRACRGIVTNPNLYQVLMDYKCLISKGLETDSVYNDAGDILKEYQIEEDHIYHCRNLKIQSLENKIDELKGGI